MNRPKALLINPWIHDFAAYDLWAKPLGNLILATWLRTNGWEPQFIDFVDPDHPATPRKTRKFQQGPLNRQIIPKPRQLAGVRRRFSRYGAPEENLIKDLFDVSTPDVILVSSMMTYWYTGVFETISLLKRVFPQIPVALGGIYATILPEHAKTSGADYILTGPAEPKLAQFLYRITGKNLSGPKPNRIEFSPSMDLIRKVRFLPLVTTRGCPYRCHYCASNLVSPRFIRRPVSEIISQIQGAINKYDIRDIALYDDAFLYDAEKHAIPLLEKVTEEFTDLRWHCPNGLHVSEITPRVAKLMKASGFETLRIGLETSRDTFHQKTGGKTKWSDFEAAIRNLKEAGFEQNQIGVYLLAGLPGQTLDQLALDIEMALAAGGYPKIAEYSPLPGTALWEKSLKTAKFPIDVDPIFHNCTLLPCAHESINSETLAILRANIAKEVGLGNR